MRISNLLITSLLILLYSNSLSINTILFTLSSLLILLFANFQNDYIDRKIDLKKNKKRFIIHPFFQFLILFASIVISTFINLNVFVLFSIMAVLINFYNLHASRKPYGFLITSFVIANGVLNLGFAFGFKEHLVYLVLFSFLFNVQREIVKSYIDYEYDLGFRRTIAIVLSKDKTKVLIRLITLVIIGVLVAFAFIIKNLNFLLYTTFSTFILLLYYLNIYNEQLLSKIVKILMLLGFISILI